MQDVVLSNGSVILDSQAVDVRTYQVLDWPFDVVVPERLAVIFDEVRTLRNKVSENPDDQQAARDLAAHKYGKYLLPEDLINACDALPNKSLLGRIVLTDNVVECGHFKGLGPTDSWHGLGLIFISNAMSDVDAVIPHLLHQWSHLLKNYCVRESRIFDLAFQVEDEFYYRDFALSGAEENFAIHMGEMMLARSFSVVQQLMDNAPIRALALALALERALYLAPGTDASSGGHFLHDRAQYVRQHVTETALNRLRDMLNSPARVAALKLLFYFQTNDFGAATEFSDVDLSDEVLTERELLPLESFFRLTLLNLAGTAIGRSPFQALCLPDSLMRLSIANTLTDDLAGIEQLKSLRRLDLQFTRVGDLEMVKLTGLPLQELDVRNTLAAKTGLAIVKRALPHCKVMH